MRLGYLFTIALRHLLGQRRQTVLTVGGVAVGVMVLLIISGLMNGLLVNFTATIVEAAPHLVMTGERSVSREQGRMLRAAWPEALIGVSERGAPSERTFIRGYAAHAQRAAALPAIEAVSPFINSQAMAAGGAETRALLVTGVDPDREDGVIQLARRVKEGRYDAFRANPLGILLGKVASEQLDVGLGDRLRLISPAGRVLSMRVVGIYATGVKTLDEKGYVHLKEARTLEDLSADSVTGLSFRARDLEQVDALQQVLSAESGLKVETWRQTNASIISLFRTIGSITTMLVVFTLVVAGFGVANVLITVVLGKSRDISLLRSIGLTRRRILLVFLLEGGLIGIFGALSGALMGYMATTLLGMLPLGGSSEYAARQTLTMDQNPRTYLMTALFALFISLVASLGPALRASKLRPIDVLRGET